MSWNIYDCMEEGKEIVIHVLALIHVEMARVTSTHFGQSMQYDYFRL